jgi:hypothetical protein
MNLTNSFHAAGVLSIFQDNILIHPHSDTHAHHCVAQTPTMRQHLSVTRVTQSHCHVALAGSTVDRIVLIHNRLLVKVNFSIDTSKIVPLIHSTSVA